MRGEAKPHSEGRTWSVDPRDMSEALFESADAPERPELSVVILAWKRRRFVRDAVRSAVAGPPPPGGREILVVHNFDDPALERELAGEGIRMVTDPRSPVGASVARGLEAARGEVVAFLDDDDEFEPEKPATVAAWFREDPELALARNGYRPIDSYGRPVPGWPACEWPGTALRAPVVLRTVAEKRGSRVLPMYNLSTISVRRSFLRPFLPAFEDVAAGSDSLVFLSALASRGGIRVDPQVLSCHRIHHSTSMETFGESGIRPPEDPSYFERSLEALRRQEAIVRGTPAAAWARWLYAITRVDAYLSLPDAPAPTASEYFEFLKGTIRERQRFRVPALAFTAARRFLPGVAFDRWWAYRRLQYRRDARGVDAAELFASEGADDAAPRALWQPAAHAFGSRRAHGHIAPANRPSATSPPEGSG